MNYEEVGERIRNVRETDLKITREEFAEEIGISLDTAFRLETANKKVKNVETYLKVSEITGLTMEELLLGKNKTMTKEKIIKRINYLLNVLSEDELDYICISINQFIRFNHKDQVKTLREIKDEVKKELENK